MFADGPIILMRWIQSGYPVFNKINAFLKNITLSKLLP